jgi:hypothetical protein
VYFTNYWSQVFKSKHAWNRLSCVSWESAGFFCSASADLVMEIQYYFLLRLPWIGESNIFRHTHRSVLIIYPISHYLYIYIRTYTPQLSPWYTQSQMRQMSWGTDAGPSHGRVRPVDTLDCKKRCTFCMCQDKHILIVIKIYVQWVYIYMCVYVYLYIHIYTWLYIYP